MAQVQLYAKKQDATSEYVNLELFDSEPIKLTLSVTNVEDPLAATSVFSKTFRVPHTSVNGPFFKGVFNVNSIDFDASQKADAYILDNGMLFTNGQITLNGIYTNEASKNIEYEITFLGETSDFGSKIGGGFLSDLNLSKYSHSRDYTTINNSWSNGLFNGDIVYGLIEWGYTYNANNQPVQPTLSNGFLKSFTNSANPYRIQQWKPQIRAKALWDTIFNEAGYTYDSTFLNSTLFKNLYVISDNAANAELGIENTFEADRQTVSRTNVGVTNDIVADTEISDPGNNYIPITTGGGFPPISVSMYVAPSNGTYEFKWNTEGYVNSSNTAFVGGQFRVVDFDTNQILGTGSFTMTQGPNIINATANCSLTQGQRVKFMYDTTLITGTEPPRITLDFFAMKLRCTNAPTIMTIASMMPNNIRKIDYMRSIINRFRLVFVPSRDIANHFTITPWKDWILQGRTIDWTGKVDTSKDLKITPLFYSQSRFQVYKDQEDADYINYNYQLTYKQTVGQLNLDSTNELIKGEKVYQDSFAPTPIAPIGFKEGDLNGSRFLIPHIAKDSGSTEDATGTNVITGKREPIQPKLRLVFYNGLKPAPVTWYMASTLQGTGGNARTTYPLMSQYSTFPVTSTTFDLSWENEQPNWDIFDATLGNGKTPFSSFNVYWKTWYDLVFDPYSRIVEASVVLDYKDVLNLKFNDYVFIRDAWYFVNKISDFVAGENTNCRVELIKIGNNLGLTIPIVDPKMYTPITLCVAATACQAYCCNANVINTEPAVYYLNGATAQSSNSLYIDSQGTLLAPAGIYSDGVDTFQVDGSGVISSFYDTSGCDCTQTPYEHPTQYSNNECGACCSGVEIILYSNNEAFISSGYLYLNPALTIPAPVGYYLHDGSVVQVGPNGQILSVGGCGDCQCDTIYPYVPCYAEALCDVCCCPGTVQVWSYSNDFTQSETLYVDNAGVNTAPPGFYKIYDNVLQVGENGEVVINSLDCTSCDPCTPGTIPVTVTIEKVPAGKTLTGTLQYSYDNTTWITLGFITITNNDPANSIESQQYFVDENVYIRTLFSSDVLQGTLKTSYEINSVATQDASINTPGSRTTVIPGIVNPTSTYEFIGIVTDGLEPCEDKVIVGGDFQLYKGTGFPDSTTIRAILGLNADGSINEDFNVGSSGLKRGVNPGVVWDIKQVGEQFLIAGEFDNYKNIDITNGIVLLNSDGSVDQNFNTTVGTAAQISPDFPNGRWVDVSNGIAYIGGEFLYWDKAPLGSTTPDLYTASPRMVAINISDGSINTGFTAQFDTATAPDTTIEVIRVHENQIYVGGRLLKYGADTRRWLYRLNLDGSLDTSFNATDIGESVFDIEFDGDYIWVAGRLSGRLQKINKSNGSLVSWGPTTKFNQPVESINLIGDRIYAVGQFTSYNGTSVNRAIALNKSDGTIYTSFNVGTGFNSTARNSQVSATHMYVTGDFDTYNGTQSPRIAKIDLQTGAIDPSFVVGTGFNGLTIGLLIEQCPQPGTFPINVARGNNGCAAWCSTIFNITVYGNAPSLIQSTQLFQDANGLIPVIPGFYSDGLTVVQVALNGIIIGVFNTSLCNCGGPQLFEYNTLFDQDVICDAVCNGVPITIWLNSANLNTATVAYTNSQGSATAPAGYYVYIGNVINVGANGVILGVSAAPTNCNCITEECAIYRITNLSNQQISSTWVDCFGLPVSPNNFIPVNGSILTSCTLPSSISSTGNTTISYYGPCSTPPQCTISLGQAECRFAGSCNDNSTCGVRFPIIKNCPTGSTIEMIVQSASNATVTLEFLDGDWYVNYTETNAVTAFANITLNLLDGATVLATTTTTISHNQSWKFLQNCGPVQATPCITMFYDTQSFTAQCLFQSVTNTTSDLTVYLRDTDGNPLIATENIVVKIKIEEGALYNVPSTVYENVIVLAGTSQTDYNGNFFESYVDDGQGNCGYEYRTYAGIDTITPFYNECPAGNNDPECRYYEISTPGPVVQYQFLSCSGNNVISDTVGVGLGYASKSFCGIDGTPVVRSGPGTITGGTTQCG